MLPGVDMACLAALRGKQRLWSEMTEAQRGSFCRGGRCMHLAAVPPFLLLCLGVADCAVGWQPVLIVPRNLRRRSLRLLLPAGGAGPPGAVRNRLLSLFHCAAIQQRQCLAAFCARQLHASNDAALHCSLPAAAASHPLLSALCPLMILLMLLSRTRCCQLAPPCSPMLPLTCTLDVCLWFAIVQENNTKSLLTWLGKCKRCLAVAAATKTPAQLCVHCLQLLLATARYMSTSAAARRRRNAV